MAGLDLMLHADHTLETHPLKGLVEDVRERGLGAEMRLFGVDPDDLEKRARAAGVEVLSPAKDWPHGWRETLIKDPDGYLWAVGRASKP